MEYISGTTIRDQRERLGMTQRQLADVLCVSDKTISKWETGRGLPDITILGDLAQALRVSVPELMTGDVACNANRSSNMRRSKFYVCPICGNVIHAMGEGAFSCCGVSLPACEVEDPDDAHAIQVEVIDGELYVHVDHPMTKSHYVSFLAYVTDDKLQMCKLYPEGEAETRFVRRGHGFIVAYCNRHGLYQVRV